MDKDTKHLATSFICNGVILLENLEELKHTKLWRQQIKHYGNRFFDELERIVLPVEAKLFENDTEIKLVQEIQKLFEDITHDIATLDLEKLIELRAMIKDLKEGKIIKVTSKQAKKLQDEKSKGHKVSNKNRK